MTNQNAFAKLHDVHPAHLSRMRSGDLLKVGVWKLENTRVMCAYIDPEGNEYSTVLKAATATEINRETLRRYARLGLKGWSYRETENREEYKKRLARD